MKENSALRLSPFPGMDPYLEAADIWPDFHDSLAGVIRGELNRLLPPPYYARLQSRPELGIVMDEGVPRRIVPDVTVVRRELREAAVAYAVAVEPVLELPRSESSPGIDFHLMSDTLLHRFVEIRSSARNHKLVTLIEIVSPSNKLPGDDRRAYERKQQEILSSDASLIEIDLLRSGRRLLPYLELRFEVGRLDADYLIMLNRGPGREGYRLGFTAYPVPLREPLPCIPVPLLEPDPDVLLDLQYAFNRVYAEGPYARMIDYRSDPEPPLDGDDAAWAAELLDGAGLRLARSETGRTISE